MKNHRKFYINVIASFFIISLVPAVSRASSISTEKNKNEISSIPIYENIPSFNEQTMKSNHFRKKNIFSSVTTLNVTNVRAAETTSSIVETQVSFSGEVNKGDIATLTYVAEEPYNERIFENFFNSLTFNDVSGLFNHEFKIEENKLTVTLTSLYDSLDSPTISLLFQRETIHSDKDETNSKFIINNSSTFKDTTKINTPIEINSLYHEYNPSSVVDSGISGANSPWVSNVDNGFSSLVESITKNTIVSGQPFVYLRNSQEGIYIPNSTFYYDRTATGVTPSKIKFTFILTGPGVIDWNNVNLYVLNKTTGEETSASNISLTKEGDSYYYEIDTANLDGLTQEETFVFGMKVSQLSFEPDQQTALRYNTEMYDINKKMISNTSNINGIEFVSSSGTGWFPTLNIRDDFSVLLGESPDYRRELKAKDPQTNAEPLDITDRVTIDDDNVDLNTPGTYPVTYSVTDDDGNTISKILNLTILDTRVTINYISDSEEILESTILPSKKVGTEFSQTSPSIKGYTVANPEESVVTGIYSDSPKVINVYYTENNYTVSFNGNNGLGIMNDQSFKYSESKRLSDNLFTRQGYDFNGWNTEKDGTGKSFLNEEIVDRLSSENNGRVTMYAQWSAGENAITFDPNGGTTQQEKIVDVTGATIDLSNVLNAERKGYTFLGWFDGDEIMPTGSIVIPPTGIHYTAKWEANPYTVAFHANTGDGKMTDQAFVYDTIQNLKNNLYTKDGYSFIGWNTKKDGSGANFEDHESVLNLTFDPGGVFDLYARWSANNNKIFFNANGGTTSQKSIDGLTDEEIDLSNVVGATRPGYTFNGWYNGDSILPKGEMLMPAGGATYVAKWTANDYTVMFDSNTGTGGMENQKFVYDVSQNLAENTFIKEGHTFSGWNTAPDGSGTNYDDGQLVTNLTTEYDEVVKLFAQWSVNKQSATVSYIDDTTGKTLSIVDLVGDYGTTDDYRTADAIEKYKRAGYELVSNNYPETGVEYNQIGDNQSFEVHFKHGISTTEQTKSVVQTIHYLYENGTKAAEDYKANLEFNRTTITDKVTGLVTYNDWIADNGTTFPSILSPVIDGYTADKLEIAAIDNIRGSSENIETNVFYMANQQKANVNYIDHTTGKVIVSVPLTGAFNTLSDYRTTTSIANYKKLGYQLVSDNYPPDGNIFNKDGIVQNFEVRLEYIESTVIETKSVIQTIHYRYQDGQKAKEDYKKVLTFSREKTTNENTGEIQTGEWVSIDGSNSFEAVQSPIIVGYTADKKEIPGIFNITGDTENMEETVTYTANQQSVRVTYIDDDDNKVLEIDTLTGPYGSISDYRTASTILKYLELGYVLYSDNYPSTGAIFDKDGDVQNFEIHLRKGTSVSTQTKIVKETIHYHYEDGSMASEDYIATLRFYREMISNNVTKDVRYGEWIPADLTTFDEVVSPVISGYTANKLRIAAIENITGNSGDIEETVIYTKKIVSASSTNNFIPASKVSDERLANSNGLIAKAVQKYLPQTGEKASNFLMIIGFGFLSFFTYVSVKKRRKN